MRTNTQTNWMMHLAVAALLVLGVAGAANAFQYTVKPGDTLMSIADKQLGNAKRWREIARFNGIAEPTEMQVGQVLMLPDDGPGGESPTRPEPVTVRSVPTTAPVAPNASQPTRTTSTPAPTPTQVTTSPNHPPAAPVVASRPVSTPTTTATSTAPPATATGSDGAGNWTIVQYIGGKIVQNGLIAVVLAAGFVGMMIAWLFSLVTPRNLLALGFVFLVVTAALFFVIR